MGALDWIGRVITRRLNRAARVGVAEDKRVELFLPKTRAEQERWERELGVRPDKFRSKLIALAAEARHQDRVYRRKRAQAGQGAKKRRPRNKPNSVGLRSRKRKLKKARR